MPTALAAGLLPKGQDRDVTTAGRPQKASSTPRSVCTAWGMALDPLTSVFQKQTNKHLYLFHQGSGRKTQKASSSGGHTVGPNQIRLPQFTYFPPTMWQMIMPIHLTSGSK